MIFVSPVPIEDVGKVWGNCKPYLSQATDRSGGRETILTLYSKIKKGFTVLWVIMVDGFTVGSLTTEVTDWKSLHVSFLGGTDMNVWLPELIRQLKEYALYNHCTSIEQTGRKGWLKALESYGFVEEPFVTMKLDLQP
jgi:hypothetical protein